MRLTVAHFARYFKRYIERELTHENLRRQWHPLVGWKELVKKTWTYNEHRPWTIGFKEANQPGTRPKKMFVEPIKEWTVFKGDRVRDVRLFCVKMLIGIPGHLYMGCLAEMAEM